jgi:hypothetical protein
MYGCIWGFTAAALDNVLLEDSVGHDNSASGGQQGVYSIAYNNGWDGFHMNGNMANQAMHQQVRS